MLVLQLTKFDILWVDFNESLRKCRLYLKTTLKSDWLVLCVDQNRLVDCIWSLHFNWFFCQFFKILVKHKTDIFLWSRLHTKSTKIGKVLVKCKTNFCWSLLWNVKSLVKCKTNFFYVDFFISLPIFFFKGKKTNTAREVCDAENISFVNYKTNMCVNKHTAL